MDPGAFTPAWDQSVSDADFLKRYDDVYDLMFEHVQAAIRDGVNVTTVVLHPLGAGLVHTDSAARAAAAKKEADLQADALKMEAEQQAAHNKVFSSNPSLLKIYVSRKETRPFGRSIRRCCSIFRFPFILEVLDPKQF